MMIRKCVCDDFFARSFVSLPTSGVVVGFVVTLFNPVWNVGLIICLFLSIVICSWVSLLVLGLFVFLLLFSISFLI